MVSCEKTVMAVCYCHEVCGLDTFNIILVYNMYKWFTKVYARTCPDASDIVIMF